VAGGVSLNFDQRHLEQWLGALVFNIDQRHLEQWLGVLFWISTSGT